MNWSSPEAFFAMGGYGVYVWGAYAVAAACLLLDGLLAGARHRRALRDARRGFDDDGRDLVPSGRASGEVAS